MEIYNIKNLNFTYPNKNKKALNNINLTIESGNFITICGKSGCGKTTLLKHLKSALTPHGLIAGNIYFCEKILEQVDNRTQSSQIGYVFQDPDNQVVTDKVWHELAFGLENLGFDSKTIRLRVAEMASFFGIQKWFYQDVSKLSGGQKQLLNLASIMATQPKVLILDEPTSQLDPIAALEFTDILKKINQELGTTIIISEHRLEDVIPICDKMVVMDEGQIIANDTPENVGKVLSKMKTPMYYAMTTPMQIYSGVENNLRCPITVNEGRKWIDLFVGDKIVNNECCLTEDKVDRVSKDTMVELKDVWFRYEKNMADVIKDLSFKVSKGELYCIVGGNGTGKTTALSIISGILKPYRGKVCINGGKNPLNKLAMLPQNPETLFVEKTVELDLYEMFSSTKLSIKDKYEKVKRVVEFTELTSCIGMHPYDLSGGEKQRLALAKVLLLEPEILLLDEPTKGLDGYFKDKFAKLLKELTKKGLTVIMVSHDIEFCAKYGTVCALFFDGSIITEDYAKKFFSGNSFYTTAANRMVRHIFPDAVTTEDVINLCKKIG